MTVRKNKILKDVLVYAWIIFLTLLIMGGLVLALVSSRPVDPKRNFGGWVLVIIGIILAWVTRKYWFDAYLKHGWIFG